MHFTVDTQLTHTHHYHISIGIGVIIYIYRQSTYYYHKEKWIYRWHATLQRSVQKPPAYLARCAKWCSGQSFWSCWQIRFYADHQLPISDSASSSNNWYLLLHNFEVRHLPHWIFTLPFTTTLIIGMYMSLDHAPILPSSKHLVTGPSLWLHPSAIHFLPSL